MSNIQSLHQSEHGCTLGITTKDVALADTCSVLTSLWTILNPEHIMLCVSSEFKERYLSSRRANPGKKLGLHSFVETWEQLVDSINAIPPKYDEDILIIFESTKPLTNLTPWPTLKKNMTLVLLAPQFGSLQAVRKTSDREKINLVFQKVGGWTWLSLPAKSNVSSTVLIAGISQQHSDKL